MEFCYFNYESYYLSCHSENGVGVWEEWKNASYWNIIPNGCLIPDNFDSAGRIVRAKEGGQKANYLVMGLRDTPVTFSWITSRKL